MNMPIPVVGNEPGPDYASDINACLTLVDTHDHTPGKGVPITPSGLNINATLDMNDNTLGATAGVELSAQSSTPGNNTVYESGVDLYFVDGNGNDIRITQSGGIAGSPGSIANLSSPASASYVSGSQTFVWESDSNIAANMDCGSVLMRNLSPNSTYALTLSPPAALSVDYTLTLPTVPASTSFLQINSSGPMSPGPTISLGITASNLAADSVTTAKILDANVTLAKMASNSVGTSQLVDSSVTTAKINDSAVTTAKLGSASVTTAKLDSNLNLPGSSVQINSKYPVANTSAVLKIIRGTFDHSSGTPSIIAGEAFTISHIGADVYRISFTAAFSSAPTVTLGSGSAEVGCYIAAAPTTTYVDIQAVEAGVGNYTSYIYFTAIGPV